MRTRAYARALAAAPGDVTLKLFLVDETVAILTAADAERGAVHARVETAAGVVAEWDAGARWSPGPEALDAELAGRVRRVVAAVCDYSPALDALGELPAYVPPPEPAEALPRDPLVHILSKCDALTVLRAAGVSRAWRRAAADDSLWRRVRVHVSSPVEARALEAVFVRAGPRLAHARVSGERCLYLSPRLLERTPNLETLLHEEPGASVFSSLDSAVAAAEACPRLRESSVELSGYEAESDSLPPALARWNVSLTLVYGGVPRLAGVNVVALRGGPSSEALRTRVSGFSALRVLETRCHIDDAALAAVAHLPLERLVLEHSELTETAAPILAGIVARGKLARLEVRHAALGDAGAAHLAAGIARSAAIRSVVLEDCWLGAEGIAALAVAFDDHRTLWSLSVPGNAPVPSETVRRIRRLFAARRRSALLVTERAGAAERLMAHLFGAQSSVEGMARCHDAGARA